MYEYKQLYIVVPAKLIKTSLSATIIPSPEVSPNKRSAMAVVEQERSKQNRPGTRFIRNVAKNGATVAEAV